MIQREGCSIGETSLIAGKNNPYPYRTYWLTGRALTECAIAPVEGGEELTDLIFEIEFCKKNVTPARARTWGDIKLLDR